MNIEINPNTIHGIYQTMKEYSNESVIIGFMVGKKKRNTLLAQYVWIPSQRGFGASQDPALLDGGLEGLIQNINHCGKTPVGVVQYNANTKKFIPCANVLLYQDALMKRGYLNLILIINKDGKNRIRYEK